MRSSTPFASVLEDSGVDVIVDIFNQAEVNNTDGMSRRVQINIMRTEKIVVLFNQKYIVNVPNTFFAITFELHIVLTKFNP